MAGKLTPHPELAKDGESPSAEGEEILGADVAAQDDLVRRTNAALKAAGLPVTYP